MKDRNLNRLSIIITHYGVMPQSLNPTYLKYNKLIGKSQVLKFPNWTRCVQFKKLPNTIALSHLKNYQTLQEKI